MLFDLSDKKLIQIENHIQKNYIDAGKYSGALVGLYINNEVISLGPFGMRDIKRSRVMKRDSIFRIFSMTKPITSVALMQLYESNKIDLDDPVHKYIKTWEKLKVYKSGELGSFTVQNPIRHMTIKDLMTHQSGLSYGYISDTKVDKAYRQILSPDGYFDKSGDEFIESLSYLPLLFSPGTLWNYSVSTDVIGYIISLVSGYSLEEYMKENIFYPLDMSDTGFYAHENQIDRLTSNYYNSPADKLKLIDDSINSKFLNKPAFFSGGAGLLSTLDDYINFSLMLLNKGIFNNNRIIESNTIDLMTKNHLINNQDLLSTAMPGLRWAESSFEGIGFGLGFSIQMNQNIEGPAGQYGWGGAASTYFWIDPQSEFIFVFLTQLMPSYSYKIRSELKRIVYSCN